jgi:hypothetical protein
MNYPVGHFIYIQKECAHSFGINWEMVERFYQVHSVSDLYFNEFLDGLSHFIISGVYGKQIKNCNS